MGRYCSSWTQANNTLVTENAFLPNRQPDFVNTNPEITRSHSKFQMLRYPQGPSTRPPGKKMKPFENTCKKIYRQGRFNVLAPQPLHLSDLCARGTDPSDSMFTTDL